MKKTKQLFLGSVLAFCFFSCSNDSPNVKRAKENKETVEAEEAEEVEEEDSYPIKFASDTTYAFKIDKPSQDTFKLVSSNWYFYYPFGNFTNPKELKEHFEDKFN